MDRRELIKLGAGVIASGFTLSAAGATPTTVSAVEQWCVFEFTAKGSSSGNPFVVVSFGALFTQGHRTVELAGFYDGDGMYKVRFSPDTVGRWGFETTGSAKELTGLTGAFECQQPRPGEHGASVSFSVCRRNAVLSFRHHLLFVRVHRRATGPDDAGRFEIGRLQQGEDVPAAKIAGAQTAGGDAVRKDWFRCGRDLAGR